MSVLFIFVHMFNPSITIGLSLENVGTVTLAGTLAFIGYLSLYRALEIGPVAITEPLYLLRVRLSRWDYPCFYYMKESATWKD